MRLPRGALAKNAIRAMFFNAIRLLAQALLLIGLARLLGPSDLGSFVGVAGLATSLGALSGLGQGLVMYEQVANHGESFNAYWRLSIVVTLLSSLAICCFGILLAGWLFGGMLSMAAIAAIFAADVILLPLMANAAYAMAAHERIGWAAGLPAAMSAARLLAVGVLWYGDVAADVEGYAAYYLVATFGVACVALAVVYRVLQPTWTPAIASFAQERRRGAGFMAVWATGMGLGSLDKTLVLRFSGAEVAGLYAPAYRAATLLAWPAESMSMAAMPRLFQKFGGTGSHHGLVAILFAITAVYGIVAAGVLWSLASLLPMLLGGGFEVIVDGVRWLSLLVPVYALRTLGGTILMAAKMRRARAVTELCGLVAMACLAILLLPDRGLLAAAAMIIVVETAVALSHWILILRNRNATYRATDFLKTSNR